VPHIDPTQMYKQALVTSSLAGEVFHSLSLLLSQQCHFIFGGAGGDGGADWVGSGAHCPLPDVEEDQQVGSHGWSCLWPMARPGRLVGLCQGVKLQ